MVSNCIILYSEIISSGFATIRNNRVLLDMALYKTVHDLDEIAELGLGLGNIAVTNTEENIESIRKSKLLTWMTWIVISSVVNTPTDFELLRNS